MAKRNQEVTPATETTESTEQAPATDGGTVTGTVESGPNHTLVYRRNHPQNRASYGIAGVPGIVVFDLGLFADGIPPTVLTVDAVLASPKADARQAKAAEAAARAEEKARKAKEKIAAQEERAKERARKADEALAKARAKVDAAKATAAKSTDEADETEESAAAE